MFGFSEYGDTAAPCNIKTSYMLISTNTYWYLEMRKK